MAVIGVVILFVAVFAIQQSLRWLALNGARIKVQVDHNYVARLRSAGVDVRTVRVEAPLLWPLTGPIETRYYFRTPEDT